MKRSRYLVAAISVVSMLVTATVSAGPIIQPVSATTSAPVTSTCPNATACLVSQNTLSIGYVSGVTDFDTYIASGPTDPNLSNSIVVFNEGSPDNQIPVPMPISIDFDLGGTFTIESMALWNRGPATQGVRDFTLLASEDSSFTVTTLLGNFVATEAFSGQNSFAAPEVFGFALTSAAFVRMTLTSVYSGSRCCPSFSEVAFEAGQPPPFPMPAPGSWVLLGLGLTVVGLRRRTRLAERKRGHVGSIRGTASSAKGL